MTQDTVTRQTRFFVWLVVAVISPFGLLLYLYPGGANDYWAWPIAQPRTAMMVGAIYFACGFYYVLLARQREWLQLQASLKSLFVVAAWLLIAAMFHWEEFFPYRILTLTWLGAYYLPLMALPILFRIQSEYLGTEVGPEGVRIGRGWRTWLITRAAIYAPAAVLLFILAPAAGEVWPWPIEPLNVRIFSGQLAVFGAFQALVMREGAWRRIRLFMLLTAFLAILHLLALFVLNSTDYNWSGMFGMLLPLMFVEWLATSVVMLLRYRNGGVAAADR